MHAVLYIHFAFIGNETCIDWLHLLGFIRKIICSAQSTWPITELLGLNLGTRQGVTFNGCVPLMLAERGAVSAKECVLHKLIII